MARPLIFVGSRNDISRAAQIADLNNIEILGILDHHYYGNTDSLSTIPVIGDERWLLDTNNTQAQQWLQTCDFFQANYWNGSQAVGNEVDIHALRKQRISILEESNANVINLIHPGAKIEGLYSKYSCDFKLGRGIIIHDNCWISLSDISIADYCQIELGTNLAHNTHIGKNTAIAPWVTLSNHHIGSDCFIGMHSKSNMIAVHRHDVLKIGNNVTVWAHSLIEKHIPDDHIYTNTNRIFKKFKGHTDE